MTTKKTKKNDLIYECKTCHFISCKKTDYKRHLLTIKHKNNASTTDDNGKNENVYFCKKCDKKFNDRAGLWRHNKKCINIEETNEINNDTNNENNYNQLTDKQLIMMLIKENSDFKTMMMEVVKNGTHNTNTHNSHNKTFNLQFFLNETCKDAMNIMDFVDSIKLQLSDLENVGKLGYVEGISNIIIKNLNDLDVEKRPVHCTDSKREVYT